MSIDQRTDQPFCCELVGSIALNAPHGATGVVSLHDRSLETLISGRTTIRNVPV